MRPPIKIPLLVPPSRRYFERLIGVYDGSVSIRDYAASTGKTFFNQWSAWRPYDGFLSSLLLSSHPSLTAEISVDHLSSENLLKAYEVLENHGDRISQLGAIEVGLRILPSRPEIEPILIHLVEKIRDDNVDQPASGFGLLSALFIFVDGELSRTRLLSAEPPFYRRLAALSQAALIHRQFINSRIDFDRFCKWALERHSEGFYLQSFVDMRVEPRWTPSFSAPEQIKADFWGRIVIAAKNNEQNIKNSSLFNLILGDGPESISSKIDFFSFLPGPLEGMDEAPIILSKEITEFIETQLSNVRVEPSSFTALVNSALIFRIGADHAELAVKALKLAGYRLTNVEDKSQLIGILSGLATVAVAAKSGTLADELRILVRRYRRDVQYMLSIKEVIRICLVAAASHTDLNSWRDFVGDWLTELAFSELKGDDGKILYSYIQYLCHIMPELWVSCGRANAALAGYNASQHPM